MRQNPAAMPEPTTLTRRLDVRDAVVVGLGAMLGAGVFVSVGAAAAVAGWWALGSLVLASAVAYANATSSAELAARYPEAGGTYVYGRRRLGDWWGFAAGWAFVVGKSASLVAMALTFGTYAVPAAPRVAAVAAVVVLTVLNTLGVHRTAAATRVAVAVVLVVLVTAIGGAVATAVVGASAGAVAGAVGAGADGLLRGAALWFFAFAGYARIATLGEEVVDPTTTIPRAIPRALGIVVVLYAAVAVSTLWAVGPAALAATDAPLAAAVAAGPWASLVPLVRFGAAVAVASVLLSLLAGVSRTTFAMARDGEVPRWLDAVHPRSGVPHRAELLVGAIVTAAVLLVDLRGAIAASSFGVLLYYGIANASAWTLRPDERCWPRWIAAGGVLGCGALAFALPPRAIAVAGGALAVGLAGRALRVVRR